MKQNYDVYKIYGLFRYMQDLTKEVDRLILVISKELNINEDWEPNIDLQYNEQPITLDEVKEFCDEYLNKGNDNNV